jgi:hypothetical protein
MADGAITPSTADPIGRWVVGPARRLLPRREDRTIRCVASGYQTGCSTLHTSSNQRVSELAGDVTRREPKPQEPSRRDGTVWEVFSRNQGTPKPQAMARLSLLYLDSTDVGAIAQRSSQLMVFLFISCSSMIVPPSRS